jgi:small-conductance mechanosensitive channel
MNISQINTAIIQGTWTNDQLTSMIDAVKFARARLAQHTKRELMLGDTVNFTSSKTGQNLTGTVTKIAIKYVTVRTIQGLWRVPANMLAKVEDREFA